MITAAFEVLRILMVMIFWMGIGGLLCVLTFLYYLVKSLKK